MAFDRLKWQIEWNKKNKDRVWHYYLKRNYNLTIDDYQLMLDRQGYVCAICKQKETRKIKGVLARLSVDHNHKTGRVRGLLCAYCNLTIQGFSENVNRFKAAANYLCKYQ